MAGHRHNTASTSSGRNLIHMGDSKCCPIIDVTHSANKKGKKKQWEIGVSPFGKESTCIRGLEGRIKPSLSNIDIVASCTQWFDSFLLGISVSTSSSNPTRSKSGLFFNPSFSY